MSVLRRILLTTLAGLAFARCALGGVLGHSGVVLHVDKHGHLSGHSTHYDYRFYPEEALFEHLSFLDPHHHHIDEADMHEAFQLIEDHDHDHHDYHHAFFHQPLDDHHHLHAYRR